MAKAQSVPALPPLPSLSHAQSKADITQFLNTVSLDELNEASQEKFKAVKKDVAMFLKHFPSRLALPDVLLQRDGNLVLEWNLSPGKGATAWFEGNKDYGYAYYQSVRWVPGLIEVTDISKMPSDLMDYLA
jgi:hypothetical protein